MQTYIIKTDNCNKDTESKLVKFGELEFVSKTLSLYLLKTNATIDEISKIKHIISIRTEEEAYLVRQEKGMIYL